MSEYDKQQRGAMYEGWAFTFCKAAFLVLLFQRYSLLILAALAVIFYVAASLSGVRQWRCWAKPPWVTIFWAGVVVLQVVSLVHHGFVPFPLLGKR